MQPCKGRRCFRIAQLAFFALAALLTLLRLLNQESETSAPDATETTTANGQVDGAVVVAALDHSLKLTPISAANSAAECALSKSSTQPASESTTTEATASESAPTQAASESSSGTFPSFAKRLVESMDVLITRGSFGFDYLDGVYEKQPSLCRGKPTFLCVQGCTGPDKHLTYDGGLWAIRDSACSSGGLWARLAPSQAESPDMAKEEWSVWRNGAYEKFDHASFRCGGNWVSSSCDGQIQGTASLRQISPQDGEEVRCTISSSTSAYSPSAYKLATNVWRVEGDVNVYLRAGVNGCGSIIASGLPNNGISRDIYLAPGIPRKNTFCTEGWCDNSDGLNGIFADPPCAAQFEAPRIQYALEHSSCSSHTSCPGSSQYCDTGSKCWDCATCCSLQDAYDGQCPFNCFCQQPASPPPSPPPPRPPPSPPPPR
eukprot:CAMPEP_0118930120 /NCGR_PEP_ID=MMETSP1169-20130426/6917_1 /TAXON_ID=36882 /ORGANISM="Pyramimonas obovata, Strain CCMP722" /LENGTH=429 /DNA_ID=CAMNT_0006872433 /DNA_START=349 /DNA_END=1638 /DNA_ORIENTATION=+